MEKVIRKIKNWWFLKKNDYPSRDIMLSIYNKLDLSKIGRDRLEVLTHYALCNNDIPEISRARNTTRERTRQILMKVYNENRHLLS